jgi:hypothetical protein
VGAALERSMQSRAEAVLTLLSGNPKAPLPLGTMNILDPGDGFLTALEAVLGLSVSFG